MNPSDYRTLQNQRFAHVQGTFALTVFYQVLFPFLSYAIYHEMMISHDFFEFYHFAILPVLACTIVHSWIPLATQFLVIFTIARYLFRWKPCDDTMSTPLPFITAYRAMMMILTCISILAVDFEIYPQYFAKTETFGTSLMDVGVGCVVFSQSLVVSRVWQRGSIWKRALFSSLPLAALGLARLISVKGLDYHEQMNEYGLHWNFFFTLTFLPLAVAFLIQLFGTRYAWFGWVGACIAIVYQFILANGLAAYIESNVRDTLFAKNKEGISSLAGYISIYLIGMQIGRPWMLEKPQSIRVWRSRCLELTVVSMVLWMLFYFATDMLGPCSRRMANLPFIIWIIAMNCTILTGFMCCYACLPRSVPRLMSAFNRNQLALFLIANLLTGAVNLTMQTLLVNDYWALLILVAYMFILCRIALLLDDWNITLKFW